MAALRRRFLRVAGPAGRGSSDRIATRAINAGEFGRRPAGVGGRAEPPNPSPTCASSSAAAMQMIDVRLPSDRWARDHPHPSFGVLRRQHCNALRKRGTANAGRRRPRRTLRSSYATPQPGRNRSRRGRGRDAGPRARRRAAFFRRRSSKDASSRSFAVRSFVRISQRTGGSCPQAKRPGRRLSRLPGRLIPNARRPRRAPPLACA